MNVIEDGPVAVNDKISRPILVVELEQMHTSPIWVSPGSLKP